MMPAFRTLAPVLAAAALSACGHLEGVPYYWQSLRGHLQLMNAARPVTDWLADPDTPEALRQRLTQARRIRDFAVQRLGLPDNASYQRYADLPRDAVVWNVVAAPVDSLTLKTWCFPVAGCVGYRGYFSRDDAQALAGVLSRQGWDVAVLPVPAYSTLGWLNWAGGDPLLSTFIHHADTEVARLVFHELAHQVVYVAGDTAFNESFASAVEQLGVRQWLHEQGSAAALQAHAAQAQRRAQWRTLLSATRARLAAVYEQKKAQVLVGRSLLAMKNEVLEDFRSRYRALRGQWDGPPAAWRALDDWVAKANNAALGAQAIYSDGVPAFEALFEAQRRQHPDAPWPGFYDAVRALARLPADARRQQLQEYLPQESPGV